MSALTLDKNKLAKALHESGLAVAYNKFITQKIIPRVQAGKPAFSLINVEELIPVRDAEEDFYVAMGEEYNRDEKAEAAAIRAKYKPALDAYFHDKLKYSYAVVDFARQVIGETTPKSQGTNFVEYTNNIGEYAEGELQCSAQTAEQFFDSVEKFLSNCIGEKEVIALNFNPRKVPSLQDATLAEILHSPNWQRKVHNTAFEILAASTREKEPEDLTALVNVWLGKKLEKDTGSKIKQQNTRNSTSVPQPEGAEPEEEHDNPTPNTSWQKKMGYGALGTALMVAPALLPREKDDKITFGKVVRTTITWVAPVVGMFLLARLMQGGFADRVQNEARSQGTGFNK